LPSAVDVSRSHTIRQSQTHTYTPVGFLSTSDQLVLEAPIYTPHNKHKRRTSITQRDSKPRSQQSSGFVPTLLS